MTNLEIHENLRLLIPGFVILLALYFLCPQQFPVYSYGVMPVLVTSFLLGLVLEKFSSIAHRRKFEKLLHETGFYNKIARIQSEVANENDSDTKIKERLITHYATRYNDPKLTYFRLPKSIGVMSYNLSIVFLLLFLFIFSSMVIITCLPNFASSTFTCQSHAKNTVLIVLTLTLYFIFRHEAKQKFRLSINREIEYWKGLSSETKQNKRTN